MELKEKMKRLEFYRNNLQKSFYTITYVTREKSWNFQLNSWDISIKDADFENLIDRALKTLDGIYSDYSSNSVVI